jgi:hypothetical protein
MLHLILSSHEPRKSHALCSRTATRHGRLEHSGQDDRNLKFKVTTIAITVALETEPPFSLLKRASPGTTGSSKSKCAGTDARHIECDYENQGIYFDTTGDEEQAADIRKSKLVQRFTLATT